MSEPWAPEPVERDFDSYIDSDPDRREPRSPTHWDFEPVEAVEQDDEEIEF